MHTATLLVMWDAVQDLYPGEVDLLNPDPRHRAHVYKYECGFEDIRDAADIFAGLYTEAFFDGFSSRTAFSQPVLDGEPTPLPVNMFCFSENNGRYVQAYPN